MSKKHILAVIPARSGSKGIPHKNIRLIAGKPMLAYSIEHAQASELITRIIVSTDSPEYAEIARRYGAETPFLRPAEISQDNSTDLEVFQHTLNWLRENEDYIPDICVHLRPTHPIRNPTDIDRMIRILIDNPAIDSVRSVVPAPETPFKMWFRDNNGRISPVIQTDIPEPYNMPRQSLPMAYLQNASIDVFRSRTITEVKSMTGKNIYGYIMDEFFDVDTEVQLQQVEKVIIQREQAQTTVKQRDIQRTFCFDIDGVIATITPNNQYDLACPREEIIRVINQLYDAGNHIILFTARGSATGINWEELTRSQMKKWEVRYHELLFGKPTADYYVDDKAAQPEDLKHILSDVFLTEKRNQSND